MIALPPRQRRPLLVAALAVVLPLATFAPLAIQAWQHNVSSWDERLSVAIHDVENRDTILNRYVDVLGLSLHPAWSVIGILVVGGVAYRLLRSGETRAAAAIAVALSGAIVFVPVLKELFARPPVDPGGDGYTFPSGHALRSMVEGLTLTWAFWATRWRRHVATAGAAVVALVGLGVVYHEWHWVSDVLAGWFLAIAWLGCAWLAIRPSLPHPAGA